MNSERFRTALLDERERIEGAIEYLHRETPGSLEDQTEEMLGSSDNHLGDAAAGTLDREIDYTLEGHSEQVLAQIDAALGRIDDGTFGRCTNCSKPIAEERLEARPWASLCIGCQREAERR
ncbi:MAG: TraR/DksA family transcriptional regulator [Chloroflexi bacterium]|nr:MAG: TraR/DksA family transcriptional regulator [Chloroflexota bacterium]